MSANTQAGHGHDDHGHADGHDHGSYKTYVTGFVLAVILTAIPFYLVMNGTIENKTITGLIIMALAVVQIVVHMIYFLHMSPRSDDGWTLMALVFTVIVVVITLSGSLWVMYHLNTNMMPAHSMSELP